MQPITFIYKVIVIVIIVFFFIIRIVFLSIIDVVSRYMESRLPGYPGAKGASSHHRGCCASSGSHTFRDAHSSINTVGTC
jgi:hypothetical protein